METYLLVMGKTPRWMDFLMAVRNRVVRLVGLKNLGAMQLPPGGKLAAATRWVIAWASSA